MTMIIRNRCIEVDAISGPPSRWRRPAELTEILLHQCSPEQMAVNLGMPPQEQSVVGMARLFRRPECGTGGDMPYAFGVLPSGQIEQARSPMARTPHARDWNRRALAVVLFGDLTKEPPTGPQMQAAVWLCSLLISAFVAGPTRLFGHCEPMPLAGNAADARHVCIGRPQVKVDMDEVRASIRALLAAAPLTVLRNAGMQV